MMKYKALYQGMYDDLKDADMMIAYAHDIKKVHPEDKDLADEIAKYAKFRLDHFTTFYKLFETATTKDKAMNEHTVCNCLWEETWKHMSDWKECIQKKIEEY